MENEELQVLQVFIRALAEGNLSAELTAHNLLSGELKNLQANLRHLNWQVQQVARGDLSQCVIRMGDFSDVFNAMVTNLRAMRQALQDSEALYRLLAENTRDVIWLMDREFRFTYISPSMRIVTGYSDNDVLGRTVQDILKLGKLFDIQDAMEKVWQRQNAGQPVAGLQIEFGVQHKNGARLWLETSIDSIQDPEGKFNGLLGVARDITNRRQAQVAEREQRILAEALGDAAAALNNARTLDEVWHSLLSNIGRVVPHDAMGIFLIDEYRIARMRAGAGWEHVGGMPVRGRRQFSLPVESTPNISQMAETGCPCVIDDVQAFEWRRNPQTAWVRSYLGAPVLIKGELAGFLGLYSRQTAFFTPEHAAHLTAFANQAADAIEKAQLIEKLTRLSITDGLTGVYNHRYFMERLEGEAERTRRYGYALCVMMLDGDDFKKVNDTYGHLAGDRVLCDISRLCQDKLRKFDLIGRYGGDELVVLLPSTALPKALVVAERLRRAVARNKLVVEGGRVTVTISIGVAQWIAGQDNVTTLLTRADNALYRAKQRGKNQVVADEEGCAQTEDNQMGVTQITR